MSASSSERVVWPLSRLGHAVERLAPICGGRRPPGDVPAAPASLTSMPAGPGFISRLSWWIDDVCRQCGIQARGSPVQHGTVHSMLSAGRPAIYAMPTGPGKGHGFLVTVSARQNAVQVLQPSGDTAWLPLADVHALLTDHVMAGWSQGTHERVATLRAVLGRRAAKALVDRSLAARFGCQAWELSTDRKHPGTKGFSSRLLALLSAYTAETILTVLGWRIIGSGSLQGHIERGWLAAWGLILATIVLIHREAARQSARVARDLGIGLRRRLLEGALNLDTRDLRVAGMGQLLGRALEADAVEGLAAGGATIAISVLFDLSLAVLTLLGFVHSGALTLALVGLLAIGATIAVRYFRELRRTATARRNMARDLVDMMTGHRTLVAQRPLARWLGEKAGEGDPRYVAATSEVDRWSTWLAMLPHIWTATAIVALAPLLMTGQADLTTVTITVGGILVGTSAFGGLAIALPTLAAAAVAWSEVRDIFHAAARKPDEPRIVIPYEAVAASDAHESPRSVLVARDLTVRPPGRPTAVIESARIEIRTGEHVLVEGRSGQGKSTLGMLLAGLQSPDSGMLLLYGIDHHTWGSRWQRHVTFVPQFHVNHIFEGSVLYNLLMGGRWPGRPEDVQDCLSVCADLDLLGLLQRMPAGLEQLVGETGWQLSHGERARICVARALLADVDVRIFDESFGALDPATLSRALSAIRNRSKTTVVIAHP